MITLPIANRDEPYHVAPTKIIALGKNYRDHIAEMETVNVSSFDLDVPTEPILFPKTPNVLIGPGHPIIIPAFIYDCGFENVNTHYEAELAFVIKEHCKHVLEADAYDVILGYTCMNDVSQRNIQSGDKSGWFRGKSLDTFGPIGPQLVLSEDIPDPQNLRIQCRLNGETVQDGNTNQMIFSLRQMVAFVSRNFTLEPGDIIMTGTPAGVGPITHGDVVEVEIEGLGVLSNPVVDLRSLTP
jgi:2-keto-4-pentenoate hydratase/2-oxohepta-3-ene-1,7-dioic acid hydratase in catechol pathway